MITDLFNDVYTWVTFSFIGFIILAYIMGRKTVGRTLDNYVDTVKLQIDEAEKLRAEALIKAEEYKQKHKQALEDAERIVKEAEQHALDIAQSGKDKIEARMAEREKQLDTELSLLRDQAMQEMRAFASDIIAQETKTAMAKKLKKDGANDLIDISIDRASKINNNS